jgi:hypothetical protein
MLAAPLLRGKRQAEGPAAGRLGASLPPPLPPPARSSRPWRAHTPWRCSAPAAQPPAPPPAGPAAGEARRGEAQAPPSERRRPPGQSARPPPPLPPTGLWRVRSTSAHAHTIPPPHPFPALYQGQPVRCSEVPRGPAQPGPRTAGAPAARRHLPASWAACQWQRRWGRPAGARSGPRDRPSPPAAPPAARRCAAPRPLAASRSRAGPALTGGRRGTGAAAAGRPAGGGGRPGPRWVCAPAACRQRGPGACCGCAVLAGGAPCRAAAAAAGPLLLPPADLAGRSALAQLVAPGAGGAKGHAAGGVGLEGRQRQVRKGVRRPGRRLQSRRPAAASAPTRAAVLRYG